jgi:hypothetical protein
MRRFCFFCGALALHMVAQHPRDRAVEGLLRSASRAQETEVVVELGLPTPVAAHGIARDLATLLW